MAKQDPAQMGAAASLLLRGGMSVPQIARECGVTWCTLGPGSHVDSRRPTKVSEIVVARSVPTPTPAVPPAMVAPAIPPAASRVVEVIRTVVTRISGDDDGQQPAASTARTRKADARPVSL